MGRAGAAGRHGQGRARRGEREGARREENGRERERDRRREGRGAHLEIQLRRSPSPKPRAPRERERLLHGRNQMRQMDLGGGGRMGWAGAPGARGPDRAGLGQAGLGHIADRNPRHARPLNGLQSQTKNRNGTRRTRDIRQRNVLRHDATPMILRFCLYMTQTPVTILV
jgi:hypothetical protein